MITELKKLYQVSNKKIKDKVGRMIKKINLISFNLENIEKKCFRKFKKKQKITLIGNWCQDNKKMKKSNL